MVDIWANNARTTGRVGLTGSVVGVIDHDRDVDWLRVSLRAGDTYTVALVGYTLVDPYLQVFDRTGRRVNYNDNFGGGRDSGLALRAAYTGDYFLAASSARRGDTGTYAVSIRRFSLAARMAADMGAAAAGAPLTAVPALLPQSGRREPVPSLAFS